MTDFTLEPKEVVLQLINSDNGTALLMSQVDFNTPRVNTEVDIPRNTEILVFAITGRGYTGQQMMYYDRVPLSDFLDGNILSLSKNEAVGVSNLIPQINSILKINLTASDYIDQELPEFDSPYQEPIEVEIFAKAESYVYQDSFILTLSPGSMSLEKAVVVKYLGGLRSDIRYSGYGQDVVYEQININNPNRSISSENTTMSIRTDADSSTGRNSKVTLTAVEDSGYTETAVVYYDRIDLDVYQGSAVDIQSSNTLATIIAAFNEAYGASLSEEDLESVTLPTYIPDTGIGITLTAKADSYVYKGSFTLELGSISLSSLIVPTSLGAFTLKTPEIDVLLKYPDLGGFDYPLGKKEGV